MSLSSDNCVGWVAALLQPSINYGCVGLRASAQPTDDKDY